MNLYRFSIVITLFVVFVFGCKAKGNLPGIDTVIPIFPKSIIGESTKETMAGVHTDLSYKVNSVNIVTDADAVEVLEFYKATLSPVQVHDYGGYYAVGYRPEGFDTDERIEIQIPKIPNPESPGYLVVQFKT